MLGDIFYERMDELGNQLLQPRLKNKHDPKPRPATENPRREPIFKFSKDKLIINSPGTT
jgi:hypothetical protein